MLKESKVLGSVAPGKAFAMDAAEVKVESLAILESLPRMGIDVRGLVEGYAPHLFAMDSLQSAQTAGSVMTPVQFLQQFLPGFVNVLTTVRVIDDLVGIMTAGAWEDEEVVQGMIEGLSTAQPYGDHTNVPLSSYNTNFERRTVVRFEDAFQVTNLESLRAGRLRVDSAATKRDAAAINLDILRNSVGFVGYNNGANRTYGYLNAPGLPAYVNVPAGAGGGTEWSTKTFDEITADIRTASQALITQSGGHVNAMKQPTTLGVAQGAAHYLTASTPLGMSVLKWMTENFPQMRVVTAPELDAANGGDSVFYLHADNVPGSGSDGGQVFAQIVPTKFFVQGVQKEIKGFVEAFSNATAGVMCKRPIAVVRFSGI